MCIAPIKASEGGRFDALGRPTNLTRPSSPSTIGKSPSTCPFTALAGPIVSDTLALGREAEMCGNSWRVTRTREGDDNRNILSRSKSTNIVHERSCTCICVSIDVPMPRTESVGRLPPAVRPHTREQGCSALIVNAHAPYHHARTGLLQTALQWSYSY